MESLVGCPKARNILIMDMNNVNIPSFYVESYQDFYKLKESTYLMFDKIYNTISNWLCDYLIIRPSLLLEDSINHSFAGVMDSLIISNKVFTYDFYKKTKNDIYKIVNGNNDFINYIKKFNINKKSILNSEICLIYQKFIVGSPSGILFTKNPVTGSNQMIIEAINGLNLLVTSGEVSPDRFIIDRDNNRMKFFLGTKKYMTNINKGGLIEKKENPYKHEISLDEEKIFRLKELGERLERLFGCSQDIEWIFKDNELYTLQSRPIVFK